MVLFLISRRLRNNDCKRSIDVRFLRKSIKTVKKKANHTEQHEKTLTEINKKPFISDCCLKQVYLTFVRRKKDSDRKHFFYNFTFPFVLVFHTVDAIMASTVYKIKLFIFLSQ